MKLMLKETHSIVCPVIRPLILLIWTSNYSPLQIMRIGTRTEEKFIILLFPDYLLPVIVIPATGLTWTRARGCSMMRLLWRTGAKPTDVAVSSVSQGIVHLCLSKGQPLLSHDAQVTSLQGKHGKVAGMSQAAPLRLFNPNQALASGWQAKNVIHKVFSLGPILILETQFRS